MIVPLAILVWKFVRLCRGSGDTGLGLVAKREGEQAILPERQIYQTILQDLMYHYKFITIRTQFGIRNYHFFSPRDTER